MDILKGLLKYESDADERRAQILACLFHFSKGNSLLFNGAVKLSRKEFKIGLQAAEGMDVPPASRGFTDEDVERLMGLSPEKLKGELTSIGNYCLAKTYIVSGAMDKALKYLKLVNPNYKDTLVLMKKITKKEKVTVTTAPSVSITDENVYFIKRSLMLYSEGVSMLRDAPSQSRKLFKRSITLLGILVEDLDVNEFNDDEFKYIYSMQYDKAVQKVQELNYVGIAKSYAIKDYKAEQVIKAARKVLELNPSNGEASSLIIDAELHKNQSNGYDYVLENATYCYEEANRQAFVSNKKSKALLVEGLGILNRTTNNRKHDSYSSDELTRLKKMDIVDAENELKSNIFLSLAKNSVISGARDKAVEYLNSALEFSPENKEAESMLNSMNIIIISRLTEEEKVTVIANAVYYMVAGKGLMSTSPSEAAAQFRMSLKCFERKMDAKEFVDDVFSYRKMDFKNAMNKIKGEDYYNLYRIEGDEKLLQEARRFDPSIKE